MNIERAILTALDRACGEHTHFPLPETALQVDVNLILPQPVTLTPLRKALDNLEAKRQVVSASNEDRGTMWKITTAGQARLAE